MVKHNKGILIILDGLGDRGIPAFGGRTPLETARTPNMDHLATSGQTGLIDPMVPGLPVSTHTATSLLFGLPLGVAAQLTRGPVEATGIGIANDPDAIYIRGNFATIEQINDHFRVIDRRAGRINEGTTALASSLGEIDLGDGIKASLHTATQHRVVIKLSGPGLSAKITNTDPCDQDRENRLLDCQAIDSTDSAALRTAAAVNRLTTLVFEKLSVHPINQARREAGVPPANSIICRCPGRLPRLHTLNQRFGLKTAVVAGEKTVLGLAAMLGYSAISEPGFTSLPNTDLDSKIMHVKEALRSHDLVYLHIKGPDICSHDLNPTAKCELLERIDEALAPLLSEDLVIGITGDHSTDSNTGRHTGDPVPSLLCAPQGRVDDTRSFGESACAHGGLGRINSCGFLASMLDLMNVLDNYQPEDVSLYL